MKYLLLLYLQKFLIHLNRRKILQTVLSSLEDFSTADVKRNFTFIMKWLEALAVQYLCCCLTHSHWVCAVDLLWKGCDYLLITDTLDCWTEKSSWVVKTQRFKDVTYLVSFCCCFSLLISHLKNLTASSCVAFCNFAWIILTKQGMGGIRLFWEKITLN